MKYSNDGSAKWKCFGRDQSHKLRKMLMSKVKDKSKVTTQIFHKMQFNYPQLLSCHEAVGVPSAKKWNLKQRETFDVVLELNLVIIVIKDLI